MDPRRASRPAAGSGQEMQSIEHEARERYRLLLTDGDKMGWLQERRKVGVGMEVPRTQVCSASTASPTPRPPQNLPPSANDGTRSCICSCLFLAHCLRLAGVAQSCIGAERGWRRGLLRSSQSLLKTTTFKTLESAIFEFIDPSKISRRACWVVR